MVLLLWRSRWVLQLVLRPRPRESVKRLRRPRTGFITLIILHGSQAWSYRRKGDYVDYRQPRCPVHHRGHVRIAMQGCQPDGSPSEREALSVQLDGVALSAAARASASMARRRGRMSRKVGRAAGSAAQQSSMSARYPAGMSPGTSGFCPPSTRNSTCMRMSPKGQ